MAKKSMSDAQKYRRANARGLDRDALQKAKTRVGFATMDSALNLPHGNERASRLDRGLKLINDAGKLGLETSSIRRRTSEELAKTYKKGGKVTAGRTSKGKTGR
jgi:hypothetical protein